MRKLIAIGGRAGAGKDSVASVLTTRHTAYDATGNRSFNVRENTTALTNGRSIAFADPLKFVAMDLYGFSVPSLWGPSELRNVPDKRYPRTREQHEYMEQWGDTKTPDQCPRCGEAVTRWEEREFPLHVAPGPCTDYLTPREALQRIGTECGRSLYDRTWIDIVLRRAEGLQMTTRPNLVVITDVRYESEARAIKEVGGVLVFVERAGVQLKDATGKHSSETKLDQVRALADSSVANDSTLEALRERVSEVFERFGGAS